MKMCDDNKYCSSNSIRTFIALPLDSLRDKNDEESEYHIIKDATVKTLPNGVMCVVEENNVNKIFKFADLRPSNDNISVEKNIQDVTSEIAADHEVQSQKSSNFLYKCLKCNEMFKKIVSYRKHMNRHQNIKKYKCTKCSAGYNVEINLKIHMAMHGGGKPVCPLCDLSFQRFASLKSHLMLHQVEEIYTCQQCPAEFEKEVKRMTLSGRKSRKVKANKEHAHLCNVCFKGFSRLSLLERHLRVHSGERPFICPHCNRGFNQKGTLQIHLSKHTGIKPFQCTLCSAKFNQKGNLRVHVEKTHTAPMPGVKTYKCPHCTCIFKKIASLNVHITKFHGVIEDNISNVISRLKELEQQTAATFNNKIETGKLTEQNKKKVNDIKKANEGIPDTSYLKLAESFLDGTVKQYLILQKKVNNMRSYVCNYCNKEFKKPSDLIRHTRVHTKEKPFQCKQCGVSFSLKSTLLCHAKTHSNNNTCSCTVCMKKFSSLRSLNCHLRRHIEKDNNQDYEHIKCKDNFDSLHQKSGRNMECYRNIQKETTEQSNAVNKSHNTLHAIGSSLSSSQHKEKSPKQFYCHICNVRFMKLSNLNRHMLIHQTKRQFECSYCSKSYYTAQALKDHHIYHLGVKDYICKVCGKKYLKASLLKRHTMSHSMQRPYVCLHCNKDFKSADLYKKHMNMHRKVLNLEIGLLPHLETIQKDNGVKDVPVMQPHVESTKKLPVIKKCELNGISEENEKYIQNPDISPVEYKYLQTIDQMLPPIVISCNDIQLVNNLTIQNPNPALFNSLSDLQDGTIFKVDSVSDSNINPQTTEMYNINHVVLNIDNIETNCKSNNYKMNVVLVNENVENNIQLDSHSSLNLFNVETDLESNDNLSSVSLPDINLNERDLPNTAILQQNVEEIIGEKTRTQILSCDICKKIFSNTNNYTKHINNFHAKQNGITLHYCSCCFKGFKKQSDLVRHIRTHTGERPFACSKCEKRFSLKSTLISHQRTHSPISHKRYNCIVCNSFFTSKSSLKVHMSVHTGDKTHECSFCSVKFRTAAHKKSHENNHHINPSKRKKNKITDLLSTVAMDAVNQRMVNLQNILTVTTEDFEKVLVVQEQPCIAETQLNDLEEASADSIKQTIQLDQTVMKQHQTNFLLTDQMVSSIHLDDGKTFNIKCTQEPQKESFPSFEKPSRNFECDICNKKYASKDALRRHKKIHGINKKFPCLKCDKGFDAEEDLQKHDKTHIGFRPYSCMYCSNSFTKEHSLTTHMKRIHNISIKEESMLV